MCKCLKIEFIVSGDPAGLQTIQVDATGSFNGYNTYEYSYNGVTYYIWHDNFDNWYVTTVAIGDLSGYATSIKSSTDPCPFAETPVWLPGDYFDFYKTSGCPCRCITITARTKTDLFVIELSAVGTYDGNYYYEANINGINYTLWFDILTLTWKLTDDGLGGTSIIAYFENDSPCPEGIYTTIFRLGSFSVRSRECTDCRRKEERVFKEYQSVKLPQVFEEQNRGWFKCCEPNLVLAHPFDSDTWKNDVTSAWIKLSDPNDTVQIELLKDGQPTSYPNVTLPIVNEPNAFYRTIYWQDVLNSDGAGCYSIVVTYSIGGMSGYFTWGIYNLVPYSIQNALRTARIRVKFNLKHEIEGINFKDSNVEDSIRFYGFIGDRQPNTEIDNLIYQDRRVRTVVRENLNQYLISTDPCGDELTRRLTDLYLLSENEMWISDYNAHNHSYRYLDIPVIVEESPDIDYLDRWQRKAVLTCKVGDKQKNQRTFY